MTTILKVQYFSRVGTVPIRTRRVRISASSIVPWLVLLPTGGGLWFINFFRKLMKTNKHPENPVNPV
jgi:hypothetical protein